ncbi:lipoprotein signal peptidase [Actibacterium mucosum KCTC 23349]|uniref:Lipoprotein signal peptidase n=1 Tax=Actibacterium mucosum KCTC 23349 TaxID=1454373 RepID=A0A037ZPC7_9RHOB|nr:signal peptidase II [Actibacterium mucosum]KAJ57520.1 lipoprotein signal peptidase [Actibacterium mucosum KCTC 23349]
MRLLALTALIIFVADQLSKYVVVFHMRLHERLTIDVLPPLLTFRMAWNEGINFGLFANSSGAMRWVLVALALAVSAGVLWWLRGQTQRPIVWVAGGFLIGGALGNVIDRVLYGAVADFLNMSCCGIHNPFSFNIADIAIFIGAVGLVLFTSDNKTT